MKIKFLNTILVLFFLVLAIGCSSPTAIPSPTATPNYSPTMEPSPTPSHTQIPTFSPTQIPSLTPTSTYSPTPTSSLTPSPTTIQSSPPETQAEVTEVIDGDTIEVKIAGVTYRVRYIGINTPEIYHQLEAYGMEALQTNRELIEGKTVTLEKDVSETDRYGRLLRYVYVGDIFVNAELVRQGLALAEAYKPDTKYQDYFEQMEAEARQDGLGIWASTPTTLPPVSASNIQIIYIFYNGQVSNAEPDEYVEITNLGDQSQDLVGWELRDIQEVYQSFTFPSYILAPGERIRVYTNEYHPEYGGFSFGWSQAIWNNSEPDTAALYDNQGREVSRKSY